MFFKKLKNKQHTKLKNINLGLDFYVYKSSSKTKTIYKLVNSERQTNRNIKSISNFSVVEPNYFFASIMQKIIKTRGTTQILHPWT